MKIFLLKNSGTYKLFYLLFLVFCPILQSVSGQNAPEIISLELNKQLERKIGGETEKHLYKISLKANQFAKIKVAQQTVSANVKLSAPDGNSIVEKNGEAAADENKTKIIEFVSQTAGDYQIEIKNALPNAPAGKYSILLTEIREAAANDKTLDEARRGWFASVNLRSSGKFDQAIETAARALEVYEKNPEADKREVFGILLNLSNLYFVKNDLAQAEAFQRRSAEFVAKNFGEESLPSADAINVLAFIRQGQRNYAEAEPIFLKVLAMREKSAGETSLAAALSHSNLGVLYRAMGIYPKAETHFSRSLTIYEKLLGDNRYETANLLNHFGLFYYGAGDYPNAEKLLSRSLKIKEKLFPAEHREIGIALNNLGLIAWKNGDYEKAKKHYLRALKIFEIVNGPESDGVGNILGNLAIIYKESDADLTKAEVFYKRALEIALKNSGENSQGVADTLSSLSIVYRSMKDFERAEEFGLRAQKIHENILGRYNHYSLLSLGNLVKVYGAKGDFERAFEYSEKLAEIHEKVIPLNLTIGSERQKIAYYDLTNRFDQTLTLHTENAPQNPQIRDLAATSLLRHKGRVLDAVSESLKSLQTRLAPEDQKLLDELVDVNARLSKTLLTRSQKLGDTEQENQIKTLEDEREKIENEISRRSAGFYQPTETVTLESVKSRIPADAALIEFAVYRPQRWTPAADRQEFGAPRYVAYIIRPSGEVEWKSLGETKDFDRLIEDFRRDLQNPANRAIEKSVRTLDEKLMKPLRVLAGGAKHLIVSPDGALNLIPFEALIDENGKYLIENYRISYLTSGRDLLRMTTTRESKNQSLIIANPLFGKFSAENNESIAAASKKPPRRSITSTRDISETYFAPLAGTISEANSIKTQFPNAIVLTGTDANENALKKTPAPRILHIATHGFFLEKANEADRNSVENKRGSAKAKNEAENPLLRSGIALAGANERKGGDANDDGILTALEASGLNLWGTKLVVLSACDTGIGEVKNGEGVYGLRRAFTLAGTESLVMSLWAVSDYATRELMTDYYKNLKNGIGRGESLRQVKLLMMKKKGREHPFYWAGFIQSGEWANLEGKR